MRKLALAVALALSASCVSAQTLESLGDPKAFLSQAAGALVAQAGGRPVGGAQVSAAPDLPDTFDVVEKIISLTNSFTIKKDGKKLGDITEKIFSWTRTFDYKDAGGTLVAKAHEKFFSWGVQIIVEDAAGNKIGEIKENILKSFFKVVTEYSILDASGREVLKSKKTDWISTDFELFDPSGKLVATMHRPWLNVFSDHWSVEVKDKKAVDSRVMVMIAAYKTAVDNDRRAEESKKKSDD